MCLYTTLQIFTMQRLVMSNVNLTKRFKSDAGDLALPLFLLAIICSNHSSFWFEWLSLIH